MKLLSRALLIFGLAALSPYAFAALPSCSNGAYECAPLVSGGSGGTVWQTQTRFYGGLTWSLDKKQNLIPDVTLGIRVLGVSSNNNVSGGDFSVRVRVYDTPSIDSARLMYVGGNRNIQGNAGLGYSFTNNQILGVAGGQSAFARIGSDYQFGDNKFNPFIEANSINRPNQVSPSSGGATSCPSGYSSPNAFSSGQCWKENNNL